MRRLIIIAIAITGLALPRVGFTDESIKVVGVTLGTSSKDVLDQYKQKGLEPISEEQLEEKNRLNVDAMLKNIFEDIDLSDSLRKEFEQAFRDEFGKMSNLCFQETLVDISAVGMACYAFFDDQLLSVNIDLHVTDRWNLMNVEGLYLDLLKRKYGEPDKDRDGPPLIWYGWDMDLYNITLAGNNWEAWHDENNVAFIGDDYGNELSLIYQYKPVGDLFDKSFEEFSEKLEAATESEADKL